MRSQLRVGKLGDLPMGVIPQREVYKKICGGIIENPPISAVTVEMGG